MPTLHLFSVAIKNYSHSPLKHPETDAADFAQHIRANLNGGWQLSIKNLHGSQATKANILNGIGSHFAGARGADVCLFYFAGHGSKLELAPRELEHLARRDGQFETIVAYDSRSGKGDIIDKELAHVIAGVTARAGFQGQGHLAVILDSCHSGDGTRDGLEADTETYRTITPLYEMPINYFYGYQPGAAYPQTGNHVQLSACSPEETAKDGVYMANLIAELEMHGGERTYAQITANLNHRIADKRPGVYGYPAGMANLLFLGGAVC